MPYQDRPSHDLAACARLLDTFFLSPEALLATFTPEGWNHSPLAQVFHPTAEQLRIERERVRGNLASLLGRSEPQPLEAQDQPRDEVVERRLEPAREAVELLGLTLWDVFSNNHSVIDETGAEYYLGSFRRAAGFIADTINRRYASLQPPYDYLDFYMGTALVGHRADLRPLYRWVFTRLRERKCDWIYTFPRVYLVDFGTALKDEDHLAYDPSEVVRAELDAASRAEKARELAEQLERLYQEDVERARYAPLPAEVSAYRDVFGALPAGWPHPES